MRATRREAGLLLVLMAMVAIAYFSKSRPAAEPGSDDEFMVPQWSSVLAHARRDAVDVPDSMTVGVAVTVRIRTENRDTCVRKGGTAVVVDDLIATIRPFNIVGSGMVCGQEVTEVLHETSLAFHQAGVATVRIERGWGEPLERTVTVRERPRR